MQARTKTEMNRLNAKVRAVCLAALRRFAKQRGLQVVRASKDTSAAFAVGSMTGSNRAGYIVLGERGYISSVPHGDTFHTAFIPGNGKDKDWKRFFARPCLSYVQAFPGIPSQAPLGDNFSPRDLKEANSILKHCGVNPQRSAVTPQS